MKRFLLLSLLSISVIAGCKKSGEDDKKIITAPLQMVVTGLSATTDLSIEVDDQNGKRILTVVKQFGNKTYETLPVTSGAALKVHYSSTKANNVQGDGAADITYRFSDKVVNVSGGNIGGPAGTTVTVKIPD